MHAFFALNYSKAYDAHGLHKYPTVRCFATCGEISYSGVGKKKKEKREKGEKERKKGKKGKGRGRRREEAFQATLKVLLQPFRFKLGSNLTTTYVFNRCWDPTS